jgi:N-acetylneuraminic acid mutarotase
VERTDFPPLPKPLAFAGGARVGSWVIVAGGTTSPGGPSGADVFGLDLSQRGNPATFQWETLRSMPRALHFPVCIGQNDGTGDFLFVLGGRDLRPGQEGPPAHDGIKFSLATRTWSACGPIKPADASAPVPLTGATGVALEPDRLLILGGDDGEIARLLEANARRAGNAEEREAFRRFNEALLAAHPGFRREMLLCETGTGLWRLVGRFPQGTPAVSPAFLWDGAIVLAGGESSPGRRSATVWLGRLDAR